MSLYRIILMLGLTSITFLHSRTVFAQEEEEEDSLENTIVLVLPKDSMPAMRLVPSAGIPRPEIFNSGFIDILTSGQVNASARFIRLFIGEPGKFTLPLSLYSGVSSNSFQKNNTEPQANDVLISNFINPLTGLANISIEGVAHFRKNQKLTKGGMLYQFGQRMLTGIRIGDETDPDSGQPFNFMNSFGSLGYYFQTGAWERNNSKNVGVTWLALRYMGCYSHPGQLKKLLPDIRTNGFFHGYSIGWGVEINNLLNIKLVHYKYIKKPELGSVLPIYQFSFNYSFKK